jgi:hypothetical protein
MKREVREQRLHDLVERYIAHLAQAQDCCPVERSLELIAHSPDSPIAEAVAGRLSDLKAAGVAIRAIFASVEPEPAIARWMAGASFVRWARDPRLLEAHEQLVMGSSRCWSGDAMRRGATKTDLFESLNEGHVEGATLGRQAFDRLALRTAQIRPRRVTAYLNATPQDRSNVKPVSMESILPAPEFFTGLPTLFTRH